jgi:hypothetical protein
VSRGPRAGATDLVGVDFARVRSGAPRRRAWLPAALAGALLAAMGLAQLRLEILRLRYALGEATVAARELSEQRSRQAARLETLRSPERLARLARERGFAPPLRVIELRPPEASARPRP